MRKVVGRTFVPIAAKLSETEELKGLLPISGKNALSVEGTQVEVGESQTVNVFWGALVDHWLGKMPLGITQGEATQTAFTVSQGAPV